MISSRNNIPAPPAPAPVETPWKKILYRFALVLVYFVTISFFKFWTFGLLWVIFFSFIGLYIFASGPSETTEVVTWAVIIVVLFGGSMWLLTASPWRGTITAYVNSFATGFNKIAEAVGNLGVQLDCSLPSNVFLERCTKAPDAGVTQQTRKGLEITTLSSETSVAVGKAARLFAAIRNDGESDATVKAARMYGGAGKNFRLATNVQCAGCAIGVTNEKISKNSRRELTADIAVPCDKIPSYPYSFNMEYEYSVGASMPVDVLNSMEYDAKIADKEAFLTQPAADSSSGPVRASISVGVEGKQPVKGGTKNILFAKLTNLDSGEFTLNNAQIAVRYNLTHNFSLSGCKLNGVPVDNPTYITDPSRRRYSTEKFVSLSCDMGVADVEGQKRYISTVDASYTYNTTRSANMELDQSGYAECSASPTTTSTTVSPPSPPSA